MGILDAPSVSLVRHATDLAGIPGVVVYRSGNALLIRSQFDSTQDILMPVNLASSYNSVVSLGPPEYNLGATTLVPRSATDAQVWPTLEPGLGSAIHGAGDDNAPVHSGWSYIGGNHGWFAGIRLTAAAHGKTQADLGSIWNDGVYAFTLIEIVDANTLLFAGTYSVSAGVVLGQSTLPVAPLAHQSGATNTATIPISGGSVNTQLTPGNVNQSVTVTLDGKELLDGQRSFGKELTIVETYTIWSYKSFVDQARINIGTSIWTLLNTLGTYGRISNTYKFTRKQVVVAQKFLAAEACTLRMGVTQVYPLSTPGGSGSLKQFMAGVGTAGGLNWSTYVNLAAVGATQVDIAAAGHIDPLFPAQRMLQFAYDSGGVARWGISAGILPVDDGHPSQRVKNSVTKSWFVSGSVHKNYPQIAWDKSLAIGESLSGTAYRRYVAPPDTVAEVVVSDGAKTWAILDRPTTTTTADRMKAPEILGSRLQAVGKPTATYAEKVTGAGISYAVATTPGYAMWQAGTDELLVGAPGATGVVGNYFVAHQGLLGAAALTGSYEILYLHYIDLGSEVPIDRACFEVTVLGTGDLRTGAYAHDPRTGKPVTTAPLADFGAEPVTSTGIKERTVSRLILPRGFWFGFVWQTTNTTAPTLRAISPATGIGPLDIGTSSALMSGARQGYFASPVSGALGALGTLTPHQLATPRLAFRRAA